MSQRYRDYRDLDGILLLNKPIDMSSNFVLQKVRHLFRAKKAGHTGALDPIATGMLPICFGEATKFSQFLLDADKAYRVTAMLGSKTTTSDRVGDVLVTAEVPDYTLDEIESALSQFRGSILQTPSMYSALKHQGQPLYRLARQGKSVERPARPVTISQLTLLSRTETTLELEVHCSKGTYIRNLVEDLGEVLGCHAHVHTLHRLFVSPFQSEVMHTFDSLSDQTTILPLDFALPHLPAITLTQEAATKLIQGQSVSVPMPQTLGLTRVYDPEQQFLGTAELQDSGILSPKRLIKRRDE